MVEHLARAGIVVSGKERLVHVPAARSLAFARAAVVRRGAEVGAPEELLAVKVRQKSVKSVKR